MFELMVVFLGGWFHYNTPKCASVTMRVDTIERNVRYGSYPQA